MTVKGTPSVDSSSFTSPAEGGSSFSTALSYRYITQGQEKECDKCHVDPHVKGAMMSLFEHYMSKHCGDVPHIDFYQAVWNALKALCELTHQSLDSMPKRCPVVPPRTLKIANLDFVDKIEALHQGLQHPPAERARATPSTTKTTHTRSPSADTAWKRFRVLSDALRKFSRMGTDKDKLGTSPSTDAVREELRILDGVLRDLLTTSVAKEHQVLSTLREFVELVRASKEDERFRLTCTQSGELVFSRPPKIATITECMAGSTSTAGETPIDGAFSTIRHGKILHDTKTRSATLIALDLSLIGPKGTSVDHAEIEITYKDEPRGSQSELEASQVVEPHDLWGLGNGCLVIDGRVFAPEMGADGQTLMKICSVEDGKQFIQDGKVCWRVRGSTVQHARGSLGRSHRWVLDDGGGDDGGESTVPDAIRLVTIAEHGMKPFDMEVQMKIHVRGLWKNSFRYRGELASTQAEKFVIRPGVSDDVLTREMAKDLALEQYKPSAVEQPREKPKQTTQACQECQA
ncbi:uncharacterized protein Z519_11798 [Cladophialophora bantiana CBS 173.52]|uniref:Uncharacterized protein n=1 Tax=Cladophialophora bantiana (strain ATCC 10958 / CBS 173.52 / CDC B-1940 / NIH 8579) TaxID=1442370 RepID=A0A0D2H9C4_CLAB1|nr:uncharacterized protein Z519_11798 [Cladophialophora bantiana CBS 173.52]KIW87475.1 hypothetical protein Z519_11798 [Cladophialophora bantiana CBS 173.52]